MSKKSRERHRTHEQTAEPRRGVISEFWIGTGVVFLCCSVFAFLVIQHARLTSATYDETTHLPSGYTYLRWNDYRMNPEHPPLVKELAALPLLAKDPWPPNLELTTQDLEPVPDYTSTRRAIRHAWASGLADIDSQWTFGHYFLYGPTDETVKRFRALNPEVKDPLRVPTTSQLDEADFVNDADNLLFWGRMPILLLGIWLAMLVFLWARELWGLAGGILAITLFCFDPNAIAHSGLVTIDVGVTLFMFGAVYFLWRTCRRVELSSAGLMLLFFALAFATKFSAVLLAPIFVFAVLGRVFSSTEWPVGKRGQRTLSTLWAKALAVVGLIAAAALAAYVMIWATYGFRFSAAKDPAQAAKTERISQIVEPHAGRELGHFPIEDVLRRSAATKVMLKYWRQGEPAPRITPSIKDEIDNAQIGLSGTLILFAQRRRLLPEAYLYGFAHAQIKSLLRSSFLRGEYSNRGFWNYFLWTFVLKTPLVTMAAIIAGLVFAVRRRESWGSRMAFLIVPVVVYWGVSMSSSLNIGHRHLLPVYPFLFVLCGGLASEWLKLPPKMKTRAAVLALAAIVVSNFVVFAPPWKPAVVYPHYLAYFNELAGGPREGYKSLVDSNLDWGQNLKTLKQWLDKNSIKRPVYLCYFGMADPRYHQIVHVNAPGGYRFEEAQPFAALQPGGLLAISATNLQGVYFSQQGREVWQKVLDQSVLIDTIGYSIFIYQFGK